MIDLADMSPRSQRDRRAWVHTAAHVSKNQKAAYCLQKIRRSSRFGRLSVRDVPDTMKVFRAGFARLPERVRGGNVNHDTHTKGTGI